MKTFNELLGKKIYSVEIDQAHTVLIFMTFSGTFRYFSHVACCSHSWFEHLTGLEAIFDGTVSKIIERKMSHPLEKNETRGDKIQFYGWTLETEKGRFDIEMRNSSNGYYGGKVVCLDDPDNYCVPQDGDQLKFVMVLEDF